MTASALEFPRMGDETELSPDAVNPDTELLPPVTVQRGALAYSDSDDDDTLLDGDVADDHEPKLSRRHRKLLEWLKPDDEVWTDEDDAAYSRGTVMMFVGLMAVAVIAAGWMAFVWVHHHGPAAPPIASQTPTSAAVPSSPPPPLAVPPPLSLDEQYLAELRRDGISSGQGDSGALGMAHSICRALDHGEAQDNIVRDVLRDNPSLESDGAQFIVTTAIRFYCPPPGG